jgi:hypothetical protein
MMGLARFRSPAQLPELPSATIPVRVEKLSCKSLLLRILPLSTYACTNLRAISVQPKENEHLNRWEEGVYAGSTLLRPLWLRHRLHPKPGAVRGS